MNIADEKEDRNRRVHPTAIVSPQAQLGHDIMIGPYCVIGPEVKIGHGVKLMSHVVINGYTHIGDNTIIYPFACLGDPPQDARFHGERSELIVGSNNIIGHYVTFNGGTEHGGLITRIGSHCMFMNGVHVAHDCVVGNHVTLVNNVLLGGHVQIEDNVVIGGGTAILQRIKIGYGAMVGGNTGVTANVIPFGNAFGQRAVLCGLNIVGMKRLNISKANIKIVYAAYKQLFYANEIDTFEKRLQKVKRDYASDALVGKIIQFIESANEHAICMPVFEEK